MATVIFAYAGLTAAHWGFLSRWSDAPPGRFMCGNVATDPLAWLVNVGAPPAAACAVALGCRCVESRRWPCREITALATFAVTSACLAYEVHFLNEYGLEIGRVWWLPWR